MSKTENAALHRAKFAVYAIFFIVGFVFANWASRLPAVRDALDYSPAQMGRILLVGAIGSVIALPLSGWLAERIGSTRAIQFASVFFAGGYLITSLSLGHTSILVPVLGLFLGGIGMGLCDTAMNLEGARVERELGQSILPRFHGAFSLGTMAGALIGAAVSFVHVSVNVHVAVAVLIGFAVIIFASTRLLPREIRTVTLEQATDVNQTDAFAEPSATTNLTDSSTSGGFSVWDAWKSSKTWLIGLIVLAAALTEGAANDWLALGIVDGFGVKDGLGAFGLFVFLSAMTGGRFVGTWLLDNYGRLVVLRLCAIFAAVGLLVFGLSPWLWLSIVGGALWGIGASLGFPVGMSAASDIPEQAAARLSAVATIGYTAFFAGPPLLGELALHLGYRHAMLAIMVPVVIGLFVSGAAKERGGAARALAQRQADRKAIRPASI